jgi:hypothetical protein
MSDDLTLHPLVSQMIREDTRDRALTMNWGPVDRDAYNRLGLRDLSPQAMKARTQIITEILAAGERFISYSRRHDFYTENQRYYRPTYTYRGVIPAVDQLAAEGIIQHEKAPPGHRGFQSRFRATPDLLKELSAVEVQYKPLELIVLRDANGNPVDYQDNRETRAMRKRLTELNEALLSQQIGVGDRIIREGDQLDNGRERRHSSIVCSIAATSIWAAGSTAGTGRIFPPKAVAIRLLSTANRHPRSITGECTSGCSTRRRTSRCRMIPMILRRGIRPSLPC